LRIENNKRKNFGEGKIMAHMSHHNTFQKKNLSFEKENFKTKVIFKQCTL
jgi:hypothetical protein